MRLGEGETVSGLAPVVEAEPDDEPNGDVAATEARGLQDESSEPEDLDESGDPDGPVEPDE
jgi:hypothetical protein